VAAFIGIYCYRKRKKKLDEVEAASVVRYQYQNQCGMSVSQAPIPLA